MSVLWRLAVVICALAVEVSAFSDSLHSVLRHHFEWGEYDSIVGKFAHVSDTGSGDTALSLNDEILVGVAFYETGKTDEAQRRLNRVLSRDVTIELDKKYVSAGALDFFTSLKQAAARDAYAKQAKASQEVPSFSEVILKKRLSKKTKHKYSLLLFGGAAVFGGVAGASQAWYRSADRSYQRPNLSQQRYDKFASQRNAALTMRNTTLVVSVVLAAASVYFFF